MAADSTDSIQTENLLDSNNDDRILNVLVTGKTGVGKSHLINALIGRNVTGLRKKLTAYEATIKDVAVKVWDSPALQDGTSNEDQYIQDMKDNIKDIALMIYCIRMDEARFYDADKKAIRILTDEFGKEVWNHAVVALTFANKVEDPDDEDELKYFEGQLLEWKKQLEEYLTAIGANPDVCIPAIPVGSVKKTSLPDRQDWLSNLQIECYRVMEPSARNGMYKIDRQKVLRSKTTQDSGSAIIFCDYEHPTTKWTRPWTWPWIVVTYLLDTLRRTFNI